MLQATGKPVIRVMLDCDGTIVPFGLKQRFFRHVGVDYRAYRQAYDRTQADPESLDARLGQARYLSEQMAAGTLPKLGKPSEGQQFTVAQMFDFGANHAPFFDGAEETVIEVRNKIEAADCIADISINTHFWATLLEGHPLVQSGTINRVFGQRFKPSADGHGVIHDGLLQTHAKAVAVRETMRSSGLRRGGLVAITDVYGDFFFLNEVRRFGGTGVAVVNSGLSTTAPDLDRALRAHESGLVEHVVVNRWRPSELEADPSLGPRTTYEAAIAAVDAALERAFERNPCRFTFRHAPMELPPLTPGFDGAQIAAS